GLPWSKPELGGSLHGRVLGHRQLRIELEFARFHEFEQQIERHDLGERSRMTQFIRLCGVKYVAGIAVHDNRRGRRATSFGGLRHGEGNKKCLHKTAKDAEIQFWSSLRHLMPPPARPFAGYSLTGTGPEWQPHCCLASKPRLPFLWVK